LCNKLNEVLNLPCMRNGKLVGPIPTAMRRVPTSGVARNLNSDGPDGYEPNETGAPVGLGGEDVGCSHIKIFIIIYA